MNWQRPCMKPHHRLIYQEIKMAILEQEFDGSDVVESSGDFPCIPAGDYNAIATKSRYDDNQKKTGKCATYWFDLIGDHYAGRKLTHSFNLSHTNPMTAEIGKREFNDFRLACSSGPVKDTDDLLDIPVIIRVGVKEDRNSKFCDANGNVNEIKRFMAIGKDEKSSSKTASIHKPDNVAKQPSNEKTPPPLAHMGTSQGKPDWMAQ